MDRKHLLASLTPLLRTHRSLMCLINLGKGIYKHMYIVDSDTKESSFISDKPSLLVCLKQRFRSPMFCPWHIYLSTLPIFFLIPARTRNEDG